MVKNTIVLLSAIPVPDPTVKKDRIILTGDYVACHFVN